MKRRKRTSDESSLPVVARRPDGKYAVQISHCACIVWSSEPDGPSRERFIVEIEKPADTEITMYETYKRRGHSVFVNPAGKEPIH